MSSTSPVRYELHDDLLKMIIGRLAEKPPSKGQSIIKWLKNEFNLDGISAIQVAANPSFLETYREVSDGVAMAEFFTKAYQRLLKIIEHSDSESSAIRAIQLMRSMLGLVTPRGVPAGLEKGQVDYLKVIEGTRRNRKNGEHYPGL